MARGDRKVLGFVRALVREGSVGIAENGTCRISDERRPRVLEGGELRRLVAAGVLQVRGNVCEPTGEARSWLRRQIAEESPHASQHRVLASGPTGSQINLAESPLARLAASTGNGRPAFLAPHHLEAGERVRRLAERARLRPRTTMSYSCERKVDSGPPGGGAQDLTDIAIEARRALERIHAALPPDCAGVIFDVCAHMKGLQAIEIERGWPRRSAKLVLRIGLDQLSAHFGLSAQAAGPARSRSRSWLEPGARPTELG